jgi:hypothetical protein
MLQNMLAAKMIFIGMFFGKYPAECRAGILTSGPDIKSIRAPQPVCFLFMSDDIFHYA